ncbi:MAG TPA: GAF domain-containing protein, partial [Anaerolineae bacterium]|nr:GAF domain-containing protein [Anaerolineae bacterium]
MPTIMLSGWQALAAAVGGLALLLLVWVLRRRIASRRELERRARELAALADAGRAIARSRLDVDALCELIYQRASHIVDTSTFQIGLFEDRHYAIRLWLRAGERRAPQSFDLEQGGGLIGWIRESKQPLLVRDFERDVDALPARPRYLNDHPPRSAVFVPLVAGERVIGVVAIQNDRPGAFADDDVRLLSIVANQAAPVIANARLLEVERRRAAQLQLLGEVGRQVAAILDLDVLFDRVVELIQTRFNYYFVAVAIHEEGSDEIVLAAATTPALRGGRIKVGQGIIGAVVSSGEPLRVNDVSSDPSAIAPTLLPETRSEVAVPMIFGGRILGALDIESTERDAFSDEDEFILRALADQAAIATHEARLYAAEREQAWISTALLQVAEATAQATSLEEVLDTVSRITPMLSGVDRCGILLFDAVPRVYRAVSSLGLGDREAAFDALQLKLDDHPELQQLAESGAPLRLESPGGWVGQAFGSGLALLLPLFARGEMAGVMLVGAPNSSDLPARKAALITGIANQAALAIESAQLIAAQREEAWVTMALLQVAEAVGSQTELDDILTTIVRLTPLLVGVDVCLTFLIDKLRGSFRAGQAYGLPRERLSTFTALSIPDTAWQLDQGHAAVPQQLTALLRLQEPLALCLQAKGEVVGVMVIDGDTQGLVEGTRRANILAGIASQTAMAIVNARLADEIAARQQLEQELKLGRDIQMSFLPQESPALAGWQFSAFWRAARQVGGDFYDFISLRDGSSRLGIAIADVADKGVPAALFMA